MASLDFYFDFLSPYAYLGWTQIHALAERHGRTVRPIPVLFAAMLKHAGTLGPAEIPAKRAYIFKDTLRTARALGVPFVAPATHPFNPLVPLRAAGVVDGEEQRKLIGAIFEAAWARGEAIDTHAHVARVLFRSGMRATDIANAAHEDPAKQHLREATDAAIAAGVFGVPTVIADGELFWGVDSFPHLERFLAGSDPITDADRASFAALVPSATRPR